MVDEGVSFTILDAAPPLDANPATYDAREQFRSAHRLWLGRTAGTDWLREAIKAKFGEHVAWYDVRRPAPPVVVIGSEGLVGAAVLILMSVGLVDFLRKFYVAFAQRLGEETAAAVIDWVRQRGRERRKEKRLELRGGPPNFFDREVDELAEGMSGELADVLRISESRLELLGATRGDGRAMRAVYRDWATGREYEVIAGEDWATFTRL